MSKFESSSHGSTLFYSSHGCLYLTWICFVMVRNYGESHVNLNQSVDVLQDELSWWRYSISEVFPWSDNLFWQSPHLSYPYSLMICGELCYTYFSSSSHTENKAWKLSSIPQVMKLSLDLDHWFKSFFHHRTFLIDKVRDLSIWCVFSMYKKWYHDHIPLYKERFPIGNDLS